MKASLHSNLENHTFPVMFFLDIPSSWCGACIKGRNAILEPGPPRYHGTNPWYFGEPRPAQVPWKNPWYFGGPMPAQVPWKKSMVLWGAQACPGTMEKIHGTLGGHCPPRYHGKTPWYFEEPRPARVPWKRSMVLSGATREQPGSNWEPEPQNYENPMFFKVLGGSNPGATWEQLFIF